VKRRDIGVGNDAESFGLGFGIQGSGFGHFSISAFQHFSISAKT
jgi:hypothetical protein